MSPAASNPFHVMVKPAGSACNLACRYCYYLGKDDLLFDSAAGQPQGPRPQPRISDDLLENFTRDYIAAHRSFPEVTFAWQGGEPTLLGVAFFGRAVELQKRHALPGVRVSNSIQTNGVGMNDEWAEFFAANGFLVGLSLDGPRDLHDGWRRDARGAGSFDRVLAAAATLRKHRVEFNALVVVHRENASRPVDVYRFLRDEAGIQFMQFIPCVQRKDFATVAPGLWPPETLPVVGTSAARPGSPDSVVTDGSVDPDDFGAFLIAVFDEWVRRDVGKVFVQTFDVALGQWLGAGSALCVFAPTCGRAMAMERDGSVYACDHYVYPHHRLGRLGEASLVEMVDSPRQRKFGRDKSDTLPDCCRASACPVRFACNGECPKNRFVRSAAGQPGLNYLCPGLKAFFTHIDPMMKRLAAEVAAGRPAANVMHKKDRPRMRQNGR